MNENTKRELIKFIESLPDNAMINREFTAQDNVVHNECKNVRENVNDFVPRTTKRRVDKKVTLVIRWSELED